MQPVVPLSSPLLSSASGSGQAAPSYQAEVHILSLAFSICRAHLDIKLTTMNEFLSRFFLWNACYSPSGAFDAQTRPT